MKKYYLIFVFVFIQSLSAWCQPFKTYNFVRDFITQGSKPTVIYFCAIWCHPCMEKFAVIIDSLNHNQSYNFYVVLEQTGYEKIIPVLHQHNYNDSIIKLVSGKYYLTSNKLIKIRFNVQGKVFKKLGNEIDSIYHIGSEKEKVWVGGAVIYNKEKIFFTGYDHDANELLRIIKNDLKKIE